MAVAQKTVMPDALETVLQDMQQEPTNEFVGLQGHGLLPVVIPTIFPGEGNLTVVDVEQTVIGDGHAMGIAAQVVEDVFGATEGWLGVNHPLSFSKWGQVLGESSRLPESLQRGKEPQLAGVKGGLQVFEKQTLEQTREHLHG
jgi:hypothetical protein